MKILLVNPNVLNPPIFPLGLEYSAEYLLREGHHVSVLDLNTSKKYEMLKDQNLVIVGVRNLDSGPGNIGSELDKIRDIIQKIKQHYSGKIGIAGSAVNILPDELRNYLKVDFALVSKGFGALKELLDRINNQDGEITLIEEFSSCIEGTFKRDVVDKNFYLNAGGRIGVATKFGCPFRCQYCNYPAIDGKKMILRPPKEIAEEVMSLHQQGISKIFFCDSNFNIPVKHAIEVLREIALKEISIDWDGFTNPHPSAFTSEYANLMRSFGRTQVHFGIDSLSDSVLRETHKGFSVNDVRKAVQLCEKLNMKVSCSLLFGHPSETEDTVRETFQNIDEFGFVDVDISLAVRIYPQTELLQIANNNGLSVETKDLLRPIFYPFDSRIIQLVLELAKARPACREAGINQYIISPYEE